ncbi:UDP-N-acetylglucosamine-dolichyl [Pseudohyphozyma bogoriensis]|nr:UDP-N-acetylglucosamine-dolichyl [Pseudohyphozyma bogoriensis]
MNIAPHVTAEEIKQCRIVLFNEDGIDLRDMSGCRYALSSEALPDHAAINARFMDDVAEIEKNGVALSSDSNAGVKGMRGGHSHLTVGIHAAYSKTVISAAANRKFPKLYTFLLENPQLIKLCESMRASLEKYFPAQLELVPSDKDSKPPFYPFDMCTLNGGNSKGVGKAKGVKVVSCLMHTDRKNSPARCYYFNQKELDDIFKNHGGIPPLPPHVTAPRRLSVVHFSQGTVERSLLRARFWNLPKKEQASEMKKARLGQIKQSFPNDPIGADTMTVMF